jgi:hypothetical protein
MECWSDGVRILATFHHSNTPFFPDPMDVEEEQKNFLALAREILKFRKEKHLYGYNYAVKLRMGHAELHDLTAICDIVSAIQELGYQIVKRPK